MVGVASSRHVGLTGGKQLVVLVGSIMLVAVPLALHVAVIELQLLPLLLPLAALGSTALRRG